MTYHPSPLLTRCLQKSLPILLSFVLTGCIFDKQPNYDSPVSRFAEESQSKLAKMDDTQRLRLARRFTDGGDYGAALRMYAQVLENDPKSSAAMIGAGSVYMAGGAFERAAHFYQRALAAEPTNSTAMAGVAEGLILTDRTDEALELMERFGANEGARTAKYHNMLGVAFDLAGRHGDAQISYSQALDQNPNDSSTISNMALSFAIAAEYDAAISLLQQLVNSSSSRSLARQNLALVYALSGELDAAHAIARTELSDEQVNTNSYFYSRLAELNGRQRARAVILRRLPPLNEIKVENKEVLVADANPQSAELKGRPMTEAEIMRNRISEIIQSNSETADEELPVQNSAVAEAQAEAVVVDAESPKSAPIQVAEAVSDEAPRAISLYRAENFPVEITDAAEEPEMLITVAETEAGEVTEAIAVTEVELTEAATDTEVDLTDVVDEAEVEVAEVIEEVVDPVYWVQLGSYGSRKRAQTGWDVLTTRQVALFGALDGFTQEIDNEAGAPNYRLFAAGYPGYTAAKILCQAMKDSGVDCLVIETSDRIEPLYQNE